jgi:hypothetical protein
MIINRINHLVKILAPLSGENRGDRIFYINSKKFELMIIFLDNFI